MTAARSVAGLIGWVGLSWAAGLLAGQLGDPGAVYDELRRPRWAPPGWLFGPVWIVLYTVMGVAAWLVWREVGLGGGRVPLFVFVGQLALNAAWTGIFFGLRRPGLAFVEIVVLWALIVVTVALFWRVRPLAGALLLPYLVWVSFAAALNFAIWRMNPAL